MYLGLRLHHPSLPQWRGPSSGDEEHPPLPLECLICNSKIYQRNGLALGPQTLCYSSYSPIAKCGLQQSPLDLHLLHPQSLQYRGCGLFPAGYVFAIINIIGLHFIHFLKLPTRRHKVDRSRKVNFSNWPTSPRI